MDTQLQEKPIRRSQYASIVNEIHRGRLATTIDERLMEVAEAVEENGGTGSITVKLSISRTKQGEQEIVAKVGHTLPSPKMTPSLWFWDRDKQAYTRDDPKQKFLEMEQVGS